MIYPVATVFSKEIEENLLKILPGAEVKSIYGTNETGLLTISSTCEHLGTLRPGVEMKVSLN